VTTIGVLAGVMIAGYAAQKLMAAGSALLKLGTLGVTAVQWAFNAALNAGKVAIIGQAVASKVAAAATLVWSEAQKGAQVVLWLMKASTLEYLGALALQKGAMIVGAAATGIATAAQWALNVALDANPIGIIVLAIAALVAGLIWFFTQTKLGQEIWTGFVTVLGDVWNWLWNSVLKPTFDAIGAIFTWLWNNIVMPYIGLIVLEVKVLGAIFTWLWNNVISPVASWIGNAIGVVGNVIGAVFGGIGNTVKGAFNGVVEFVRGIFNGIIDMVNGVIGTINGIGAAVAGIPGAPKIHIGTLPHLATGGTMTRAGMALVGENGPEVVKLPAGATVYPHGGVPANQSGGGLHIENFYATPEQSPREISQELGWMQRWAT
jgi:hypothetical protein